MSTTWDIVIEAGSLFDEEVTLVDPETGDPLDLTDYDPANTVGAIGPRAQLRLSTDEGGSPLQTLAYAPTYGNEGISVKQPPTLGTLRVVMYATTSAGLSYSGSSTPLPDNRNGVWSGEIVPTSENLAKRVWEGAYEIKAEVVR